jgi:hypothetical protein
MTYTALGTMFRRAVKKERKVMQNKSQKCYISRSRGGGTSGAISMKFEPLVHIVNVINSAKFDHCNFNGLNYHFLMLNLTAHTTGLALTRCL